MATALLAAALLAGCGHAHASRLERAIVNLCSGRPVGWRTLLMPAHAPRRGFAFDSTTDWCRIESELGTYTWRTGAPADSPAVAKFTLTAADRDSIWGWLLDADYFDLPPRTAISGRDAPPVGKCTLRVDVDGKSRVAEANRGNIFERGRPLASRGNQLAVACVRIRTLVERKPAVRALPKPVRYLEM